MSGCNRLSCCTLPDYLREAVWLRLGFRPFFLGAATFSITSTLLWMAVYVFQFPLPMDGISPWQWHAHEMVYGFAGAVVAGFLLTAVQNWTGVRMVHGPALLAILTCWAIPRVLFLFGTTWITAAAFFDLLFIVLLTAAVTHPIAKVKQWKQLGILGKLAFFGAGNALFYLGALGIVDHGVQWGIYSGLFLIIGLIVTIGRRAFPSFIEAGVGYPMRVQNFRWVDKSGLPLYLLFFIAVVFVDMPVLTACLALALFVVTTARLWGWHTVGIWNKPLLWGLFMALSLIDLGLLLFALLPVLPFPRLLAIHTFAFGGIGLVTLSMMCRVSLAHTGRNLHQPPKPMVFAFLAIIAGTIVRVLFPLVDPAHYPLWITIAQLLWIGAFGTFVVIHGPMLVQPRKDGATNQ